jgi:hypothetical protein
MEIFAVEFARFSLIVPIKKDKINVLMIRWQFPNEIFSRYDGLINSVKIEQGLFDDAMEALLRGYFWGNQVKSLELIMSF